LPFIENALEQLEEHGPNLEGKFVKNLGEGIYELRRATASGQFRLFYFFFFDGSKIIITHGIHKKAKKKDVYKPELKRALEYKNDYYNRHQ
jgi:phage-related protein